MATAHLSSICSFAFSRVELVWTHRAHGLLRLALRLTQAVPSIVVFFFFTNEGAPSQSIYPLTSWKPFGLIHLDSLRQLWIKLLWTWVRRLLWDHKLLLQVNTQECVYSHLFSWFLCLCCPTSLSLHLFFLRPSSCLGSAFDNKWHWVYVGVKWIGLFQGPESLPVLDTSHHLPLQGNECKIGTCWEWRLSKHPWPETSAAFPPSGQVVAT